MIGVQDHRRLCRRRHAVVQFLDRRPNVAEIEYLARDGVGAGDLGRAFAGFFHEFGNEGIADPIDQGIGQPGSDDLAAQPVPADVLQVLGPQGGREIIDQVFLHPGVVRQV